MIALKLFKELEIVVQAGGDSSGLGFRRPESAGGW
jgi:hypothetical protein